MRDASDRPIGRVAGSQTDRATGDAVWLLVELSPETTRRLDHLGRFCWLPYNSVGRIRRDGIHLAEDGMSALLGFGVSQP